MKKFFLTFVPSFGNKPKHTDFVITQDDDFLKGEIERLAMRYEKRYNVPYRCVSVEEIKGETKNDLP